MGANADRALYARMLAAVGLLALVTVAFVASVWLLFYGLLVLVGDPYAPYTSAVVAAVVLLAIAALERRQIRTIEGAANATEVDSDAYPDLYARVTRLAAVFDLPTPTLAVADTDAPQAMAVGFRSESARLILSRGTLEALSDEELEAVIAHELAHLQNRDAMVMTAVSVPAIIADGLRGRMHGLASAKVHPFLRVVPFSLYAIGTVVWAVSRVIVAVLSRYRELTADRAAIEATGSPAALASALGTLDERLRETPSQDLREVEGVSSLSILPLEVAEVEKVMLGPEGDVEPFLWSVRAPLKRLTNRVLRTHPPTDDRLERLAGLERRRERE